jgi:hypothetical protein
VAFLFYGDASGTSDRSNIAVGGYVSTIESWEAFKPQWEAEMHKEGVDYFRRSQMEPPFHGDFAKLGWTVNHQKAVLKRLHRLIKRHTIKGVAKAIRNKAFAEMVSPKIKRMYGGPYGWAMLLNLVDIGLWARRRNGWVSYFFEAGDEGQGQINTAISELYGHPKTRELLRIHSWSFVPKKGQHAVIQLQSADFIAFEAYKDIENFLAGSKRPARKSRKDLIRKGVDQLNCWADEAFSRWLVRVAECNGHVINSLITDKPNT